jgi:hypothetical protein
MRSTKYVAPVLAAAAIAGTIGLAPVAIADPGAGPAPHQNVGATTAPAPAPFETGPDPLVPTGGDPYVPDFPGTDRAF